MNGCMNLSRPRTARAALQFAKIKDTRKDAAKGLPHAFSLLTTVISMLGRREENAVGAGCAKNSCACIAVIGSRRPGHGRHGR
jgi:hypothetical protein